jgi:hypothetical protein
MPAAPSAAEVPQAPGNIFSAAILTAALAFDLNETN